MKKIHTVPFHLGDLIKDTYAMDATEFGAYMRLLIAHYSLGIQGIPDNDTKLARMAGASTKVWQRISPAVREKFTWKDGFGIHQRVLKEIQCIRTRSTNARSNALKRYDTPPATAEPQQCDGSAKAMLTNSHKPITNNQEEKEVAKATTKKKPAKNEAPLVSLTEYLASLEPTHAPDQCPREWCEYAYKAGYGEKQLSGAWTSFARYWNSANARRGGKMRDWTATFFNNIDKYPAWRTAASSGQYRSAAQRNTAGTLEDAALWAGILAEDDNARQPRAGGQPAFSFESERSGPDELLPAGSGRAGEQG